MDMIFQVSAETVAPTDVVTYSKFKRALNNALIIVLTCTKLFSVKKKFDQCFRLMSDVD